MLRKQPFTRKDRIRLVLSAMIFATGIACGINSTGCSTVHCPPVTSSTDYPFPAMIDPTTGRAPIIGQTGPTTPITNAPPSQGVLP